MPAIEIDTELANKDAYRNYDDDNEDDEEELSEIEQDLQLKKNMMIHIEGEDNINIMDEEGGDADTQLDH